MKSFVFCLYKYFFSKILQLFIELIARFSENKIQQIVFEKNQPLPPFTKNNHHKVYWIHAASGEIEYARPVIREIKKRDHFSQIIVTYNSISAKKTIKSLTEIDCSCIVPWENASLLKGFIQHFQPDILMIARTDAWPVMIDECHKQKIPIYLFSATLAAKSNRLKFPAKYLSQKSFEQMTKIFCVSFADKKLFESLSPQINCQVTGDTRYDQTLYRLQHPKNIQSIKDQDRLTLIIGSSWPEDEKNLLPALAESIKNGSLQVILAPHETNINHLQQIEKLLNSLHLKYTKFSQIKETQESIIIVDQVGILAEIYLQGDFAFVGGSFKKQVHSVMEPLTAGLITFVGPYYENNREAIEFSNIALDHQFKIVNVIQNGNEFKQHIQSILKNKDVFIEFKRKINNEIAQKSGSTTLLLNEILKQTID